MAASTSASSTASTAASSWHADINTKGIKQPVERVEVFQDGLFSMIDNMMCAMTRLTCTPQMCSTASKTAVASQAPHVVVAEEVMPLMYVLCSRHGPTADACKEDVGLKDLKRGSWSSLQRAEDAPHYDGRPRGGLCTQALLAVLRGACHEPSRDSKQNELQTWRTLTFEQLLASMHRVVSSVGFPHTVLRLQSSAMMASAFGSDLLVEAFPRAEECSTPPRALLIGVSYLDSPEWRLDTSQGDILEMRNWLLSELKWPPRSIRLLVDKDCGVQSERPTKSAIIRGMRWLLEDDLDGEWPHAGANRGCRLLHFCGRGGADGLHPLDWSTEGAVSEHALATIVKVGLPKSATLMCVLDSNSNSLGLPGLQHELQVPAAVTH